MIDIKRTTTGAPHDVPRLAVLLLTIAVAACGSSEPDPAFAVHYPLRSGVTDTGSITVRGTAVGDVAAVRVNGALAQTDNGFADWQLPIALEPGDNELTITAEDSQGNPVGETVTASVEQSAIYALRTPYALAGDPAGDRVIVLEEIEFWTLVSEIDLATGARRFITGTDEWTSAIAVDPDGNRLLTITDLFPGVTAIDLDTGVHTAISNDSHGTGPALVEPDAIAIDPSRDRALVFDTELDALIAIELATGDRTVLADATTGTGAMPTSVSDMALAADASRVIVADIATQAVLSIDLDTGDRRVISAAGQGEGPLLNRPLSLAVDGDRALVLDSEVIAIIAVDLTTGDRAIVSGVSRGAGALLQSPRAIVADPQRGRAVVADRAATTLLAIDRVTGDRSILASGHRGAGPGLAVATAVLVDPLRQQVFVGVGEELFDGPGALLAVDLTTSDRALVSGRERGAGPALALPMSPALHGDHVLVLDHAAGAVVAIDPDTGDRHVVTGPGVGSGPVLAPPVSMAVSDDRAVVLGNDRDALFGLYEVDLESGDRREVPALLDVIASSASVALDGDRALVVDARREALVAIELDSGQQTIISDDDNGAGPGFIEPLFVAVDRARNRAIVLEPGLEDPGRVFAVDLASGDRTLVAGADSPAGPLFGFAWGLSLTDDGSGAFVAHPELGAVGYIDLATGQRMLLSR